jgi:hypothetical protein
MFVFPTMDNMSEDTLTKFKGNKLIFIGEHRERMCIVGQNADNLFFDILKNKWTLEKEIMIQMFTYEKVYLYKKNLK